MNVAHYANRERERETLGDSLFGHEELVWLRLNVIFKAPSMFKIIALGTQAIL